MDKSQEQLTKYNLKQCLSIILRLLIKLRLLRIRILETNGVLCNTETFTHWRSSLKLACSTEETFYWDPSHLCPENKCFRDTHYTPFWIRELPSREFSVSPEILWADSILLESIIFPSTHWVALLWTIRNQPTWYTYWS